MRSRRLAALAIAPLLAACGGKIEKPQGCRAQADCPAESFCREAICVASAPPIAVITAPAAPLRSHTKLAFAGAESRDPDPEDRVASLSWTVRKVQADCDPFPASAAADGKDVPFTVVFGCAGTFEVRLVATDTTGRTSEPAAVPLTVALSDVVPAIAMGPDLQLQHLCTPGPLCTPGDSPAARTFALSATATSPVSSAFHYQWTVELPATVAVTPPRVIFTPSETAAAPTVRIETDGTAIAGDYVFTAVATDEYRLAVAGRQKVTVGNRPPVVTGGGAVQVAHRYDATTAPPTFRANGVVAPASVADPDGDPLVHAFAPSTSGAGGTTFDVVGSQTTAAYAIGVPYRTAADAQLLLGAPGLSRTITYTASDPNGGQASVTWDVQVMNRAPRVTNGVPLATVHHSFDIATSRYLASALASEYVDDDGDPIVQSAPTGDPVCTEVSIPVGGGPATVGCALIYAGVPRVGAFAGSHPLQIVVGDPWSTLPAQPFALTIQNRPPALGALPRLTAVRCTTGQTCCDFDPVTKTCLQREVDVGSASIVVPPPVVDPDGDPLAITFGSGCASATPAALSCALPDCPNVTIASCGNPAACGTPAVVDLAATATDGAASVSGALSLETNCP